MSDFLNEMVKKVNKTQDELLEDIQSRYDVLIEMIEHSLYCIEYFLQTNDHEDNSIFVLYELFSKSCHTTRALLLLCYSGFELQCLSLIRDLIETEYLIAYFLKEPQKMESWFSSDEKIRKKDYSPSILRKKIAGDDESFKKSLDRDYSGHSNFLHVTPEVLKIQKGLYIRDNKKPDRRFVRTCLTEIAHYIVPIADRASSLGLLITNDDQFNKNGHKLKEVTKSMKFFWAIGVLPIWDYLEKDTSSSKKI